MMFFRMVWYTSVCGIHYPRNGSVRTILTLSYHKILCSAHVITYHAKIKNRSTMAGRRPDSQYLSEYCFIFWSQISAVILMTARLWRHARIHMGRKNHWVLLPKRSWTQISDISEFWQSGKKSPAIFDPANSGQLLLPSLLKMGGSGGFIRQKGEFIVFFHFSCQTCMKSHLFHAFSPKLAANMQQSTLKEKKN